jgi:hypothetical protein
MASELTARVWLMKGSCRSSASTAEQLGSTLSPVVMSAISGYYVALKFMWCSERFPSGQGINLPSYTT